MPRLCRVHNRKDFDFIIVRGAPHFSRAAYACVITQLDAWGRPNVYHVETFYAGESGRNETGVQVRARATRYGSAVKRGARGVAGYRTLHLPSNFPSAGIPWREDEVTIPGVEA